MVAKIIFFAEVAKEGMHKTMRRHFPAVKTGKARAIRFSTLNSICKVLDCKPGDILDYEPDPEGIEEGL